ncbi:MAG: AraD1 family protein [Dehalococcoidia bacterium]|nr:MAG: sugar transporter [Chloroflexi bacterium TMED70]RZP17494.1 MAG: sugar transporter [Chloroflexota bacterium]|tara:strand:- start:1619 stop:2650 length:1032 start_codon:yes stop_codon:yes gene_type:complete
MKLIQLSNVDNSRIVGLVLENKVFNITKANNEFETTYKLINYSITNNQNLDELLNKLLDKANPIDFSYDEILNSNNKNELPKILVPIDHPDPYRLFISGTGLTHTGSVKSRDMMHNDNEEKKDQTDSAKMFQMGIEGGKPEEGKIGVAPEWFYKGNGTNLKGPNDLLEIPNFSLDGGEEPEVVGCYFIDPEGNPVRLGFTLGNEFSDHETEQINYLYLAHSKMRNCSIGPELDTSLEFKDISINCDIERDGGKIYKSGPIKSGEEYMSHSLSNMEYHHFKYDIHRLPGDLHLHYFGTSQLSYSTRDWKFKSGDKIIISSEEFDGSLKNEVKKVNSKEFNIRKV